MVKRSADQKLIRITNQNLIIDTIRTNESATRSSLSKTLQLSVPSVCANVDQLIELGIIRETGEESSSVGRKAKLLKLNNDFGYLVSIDLSNPCVTIAISSLKPEIVHEHKFDLEQFELERLTDLLLENIERILTAKQLPLDKMLAISLSVPGIVDSKKGIADCGSYLTKLGKVPFRDLIQRKYDVPVLVQKDIDAAVIAEMKYGVAKACKDVVFVSADVGVGLGIVLNGGLFKGSSQASGEMCKFVMDREERLDDSPKKRLVDLVSVGSLVQAVRSDLTSGAQSVVLNEAGGQIEKVDFNTIIRGTLANDDLCVKHVRECARIMGIAVTNMLLLLDLECVILGGGFVTLGPAYTDTLAADVRKHISSDLHIVNTMLKNKAVLLGGIAIGLESIFEEVLKERSVE
ncbi:ROK family protein [Paenibacillus sp. LHD-117]|uniref:ROK family protein n=1 Tax=Paenibacillus sp. LHD-117 TaxID=3071412 RepID=UPI0027E18449|nr:ROK family protein [Paenibacillus sp. LHD-117]MDQ6419649.1 ROK family protein [Paenibacillus sp. LHD-117]